MFKKVQSWFLTRTWLGRLCQAYREHVRLCLTSGYVASPLPGLVKISKFIFRLWCYLQVGPLKIVGKEKLDLRERAIYCGNHSSFFDAVVVHPCFRKTIRYMGAYEALMGFCGLKAILMTRMGVFAVDRAHGKTVLGPACKLLVAGESLAIFPEGKIYNCGCLGEFKPGPALIARAAWKKLGDKEKVAIVPYHIHYRKRHRKSGETFNFLKMGFKWRGGVVVYVGDPIWMHEHEKLSIKQLTELLKERIAALCPAGAGTHCCPGGESLGSTRRGLAFSLVE